MLWHVLEHAHPGMFWNSDMFQGPGNPHVAAYSGTNVRSTGCVKEFVPEGCNHP